MIEKSKKTRILFPCFLLPMVLMAAVFVAVGICPFGERSLGVMDMPHQYIAFLCSLQDILTGRASALYLPSMAMGGSMAGLGAYYLASPLNILCCLFPKERMYLAVSLLFLLRTGLCGLTMGLYCGERHGWHWHLVLSALSYGLMAYMLSNSFNYMWLDCVVLLPLVALGVARLAEGRGILFFSISLAAALVCNFYIAYMLCLFSVLFFFFEVLNSRAGKAVFWHRVGSFALGSVWAGCLASVVLLPALLSLPGGKAGLDLSALKLTPKFSLRSLFSKLLPGAYRYEQIMPGGLPNLFCGTASLAFTALFFADRTIPRRRRLLTGGLFLVLILSMWVPALDLVWHGMNEPNWYNGRYSFLFGFLLAAAADRALAGVRAKLHPRSLCWPALTVVAVVLCALVGRQYDYVNWNNGLAAILVAAAVCAIVYFLCRCRTRKAAVLLGMALLFVHAAELFANGYISLQDLTATASNPASFQSYVREKADAMATVDTGGSFVRVESPESFDLDRCEPMLFGYDGLSHYSSNVQSKNLDFLDSLGLDRYQQVYAVYGPGVTSGAESFLGVGYLVTADMHKAYPALESARRYTVYANPYALPTAFTAGDDVLTEASAPDCFARIQDLYAAVAPEVNETIYTRAVVEDVMVEGFAVQDGRCTLMGDGLGAVTFTLTTAADGPLYGVVEIPDFPVVSVFVNGAYCASYATTQTNGSLFLGDFTAGERVQVRLETAADITIESYAFASENTAALAAYKDAVAPGGCALTKRSNSRFAGTFTTGEDDDYLLITVPYDAAWRIKLDGERAQPVEVQGCLLAVPVSAGEHSVEMRYVPRGLLPGAVVSAAAAVCLLLVLLHRHISPMK